jgi:signal transduction histidine kinase
MLLDAEFGPLNDEQRGALDSVNQAAHRLLATASDLLDVTRIEAGRIDLQLVPTDLADVVRQVAAELAPQHRAKGQALSVDVAHDLPLALCDATRMEQVLTNLISNASAYTPDSGHLGVEVRLAAEPGYLQVTVSDDGVGIAEDDQVHVFSRFYRAAATRRMSANGLGLGLTIARELVELQGGRIWLESAVGKGTRVTFTLPAV